MRKLRLVLFFFLTLVQAVSSSPQEKPPLRRFTATKTTSEITIDGYISPLEWSEATVIDLPYEWFPGEPEFDRLFLQFLLSYKVNPRTVFFAGYSDNYNGLQNVSLTQTGRTFFLKIGYAWTM